MEKIWTRLHLSADLNERLEKLKARYTLVGVTKTKEQIMMELLQTGLHEAEKNLADVS